MYTRSPRVSNLLHFECLQQCKICSEMYNDVQSSSQPVGHGRVTLYHHRDKGLFISLRHITMTNKYANICENQLQSWQLGSQHNPPSGRCSKIVCWVSCQSNNGLMFCMGRILRVLYPPPCPALSKLKAPGSESSPLNSTKWPTSMSMCQQSNTTICCIGSSDMFQRGLWLVMREYVVPNAYLWFVASRKTCFDDTCTVVNDHWLIQNFCHCRNSFVTLILLWYGILHCEPGNTAALNLPDCSANVAVNQSGCRI